MKHLYCIILLLFINNLFGQSIEEPRDYYHNAYLELKEMLEGKIPLDIKKAVFAVERLL